LGPSSVSSSCAVSRPPSHHIMRGTPLHSRMAPEVLKLHIRHDACHARFPVLRIYRVQQVFSHNNRESVPSKLTLSQLDGVPNHVCMPASTCKSTSHLAARYAELGSGCTRHSCGTRYTAVPCSLTMLPDSCGSKCRVHSDDGRQRLCSKLCSACEQHEFSAV
jgi:hypothetical protein